MIRWLQKRKDLAMAKKRKNPKLYTGVGDLGTTRLMYNSEPYGKYNFRVKTLADFEVAYHQIAMAMQYEWRPNLNIALKRLRKLGAELGTHPDNLQQFYDSAKYAALDESDWKEVEEWIEEISEKITIEHGFVYADIPEAASIDLARAHVRVLETRLASIRMDGEISDDACIYINRLGDWLFALARYVEQENRGWHNKLAEQEKVK